MAVLDNREYEFSDLMEGRRFIVPEYQRYFAWEEDHLQDLWDDLMNAIDRDGAYNHFMGQIICNEEQVRTHPETPDIHEYAVVDGQQRLTTLIILIHRLTDRLADQGREVSAETERYLQGPAPDGTDTTQKMQLQSGDLDDNRVFTAILAGETDIDASAASELRLVAARDFFDDRLEAVADTHGIDRLERLLELVERVQFMVYNVRSEEKAALIYETVNDRGKQLTDLEKTKSFLMHQTSLCTDEDATREERIQLIRSQFAGIYLALQEVHNVDIANTMENLVVDEDILHMQHFISYIDDAVYTDYLSRFTDDAEDRATAADHYVDILKWWIKRLRAEDETEAWTNIRTYTEELSAFFQAYRHLLVEDDDPLAAQLSDIFEIGAPTTVLPLLVRAAQQDLDDEEAQDLVDAVERYLFSIHSLGNKRRSASRNRFYTLAYRLENDESSIPDVINRIK